MKYREYTSALAVKSSLRTNENRPTTIVNGINAQLNISQRVFVIWATIKRHFKKEPIEFINSNMNSNKT